MNFTEQHSLLEHMMTTIMCNLSNTLCVIQNSIGLLNLSDEEVCNQSKSLIQGSIDQANSKIQFLTNLFKADYINNKEKNLAEIIKICCNYNQNLRCINFDVSNIKISVGMAKILMCIVEIATSNIVCIKNIQLEFDDIGTENKIAIRVYGDKLAIKNAFHEILKNKSQNHQLSIDNVFIYYCKYLIDATKSRLVIQEDNNSINYIVYNLK